MALSDITVTELDELAAANDLDGYPTSGNKAEKVAALDAAGIEAPARPDEPDEPPTAQPVHAMQVIDGVRYRPEDAARVRNKARTVEEGATGGRR